MAKERRRSDRGGEASRSAAGVGFTAQAASTASLDDGRRSERRARRTPLTGRASHGVRHALQGFGSWSVQQERQRWNALSARGRQRHESGGVARRARFDRGPAKDRATPVLRASAQRRARDHRSSARHRQMPPTRESDRASPSGTSAGIDGSAGARERASVITVRKRRILPGRGMGREAFAAVEIAWRVRPTTLDGGARSRQATRVRGKPARRRFRNDSVVEQDRSRVLRFEMPIRTRGNPGLRVASALNRRRAQGPGATGTREVRRKSDDRALEAGDRSSRLCTDARHGFARGIVGWLGFLSRRGAGGRRPTRHANERDVVPRRNPNEAEVCRGKKPRRPRVEGTAARTADLTTGTDDAR